MSHAFSLQSYPNFVAQRERWAVKGGEVTGLECTSELILLFSELGDVDSKHWMIKHKLISTVIKT